MVDYFGVRDYGDGIHTKAMYLYTGGSPTWESHATGVYSGSSPAIYRAITLGTVWIEFDCCYDDVQSASSDYDTCFDLGDDSNLIVQLGVKSSKWYANHAEVTAKTPAADTWYHVLIYVDVANDVMDLYIDGEFMGHFAFITNTAGFTKMLFQEHVGDIGKSWWVDNLEVYQ